MSCQGRSPDGEAREPSCQRVAAHGQQLPAEHHLVEEAREQECEHDRHRRHERKRANTRLAEGADLVGDVIEGRGVGDAEVVGRHELWTDAGDTERAGDADEESVEGHAWSEAARARHRGGAPPAARVTLSSPTASSRTAPRKTVIQKLSMPTSSKPLEM